MQAAAVTEIRVRDDRVLASAAHEATRIAQGTGAPEEQWPTLQEIVAAQQQVSEIKRQTLALCLSKDVLLTEEGKIYIPDGEHGLRHRVLVIAHAGAAGHRRQKATTELLKSVCWWEEMADDLAAFLSNCLLCMKTATNQTAPRPYGQTLNGQQPGEALHMDYCSMLKLGETSNCRFKGILVAKDGLSGFLLLNNVEKYDAETTEACAIQWASIFGVPLYFISDGGSHFNNKIVIALMKRFRTLHHIVTAYAPWANGTIERVMREIVKLYRLLLAESNLPIENWHLLTPLVQATLKRTAVVLPPILKSRARLCRTCSYQTNAGSISRQPPRQCKPTGCMLLQGSAGATTRMWLRGRRSSPTPSARQISSRLVNTC